MRRYSERRIFRSDDDCVESSVRGELLTLGANGGPVGTSSGAGGAPDEEATVASACPTSEALTNHFDRIEEKVAFDALMNLAAADTLNPSPGEKRKYAPESHSSLASNNSDGGGSKPPPPLSSFTSSCKARQNTFELDTTPFPKGTDTGNHFPVSNGVDRLPPLSTLPREDCPPYETIVNFARARCKIELRCVMCGKAPKDGESGTVIPQQNKDVCRDCDRALWVHNKSRTYFKWCKGCKCFRNIFAFSEKLAASKCNTCRERGRRSYLQRVSGARAVATATAMPGTYGSGSRSSGGSDVHGRRGCVTHGGLSTGTAVDSASDVHSAPLFIAPYTLPLPGLGYDHHHHLPPPSALESLLCSHLK